MKRAEILQQFCDSYFRLGETGAKLQEATQSDDVKSCGNFGWEARVVHFWPQVIRDLLAMKFSEPPQAAVVAGQNSPERGLTPAAGEMVEVNR